MGTEIDGAAGANGCLHMSGSCKPCAFYHKEGGCGNGASCVFCHFCQPGEKERRRKARRAAYETRNNQLMHSEYVPQWSATYAEYFQNEAFLPMAMYGQAFVDLAQECEDNSACLLREALSADLPSLGSAGHTLGTCKPCAFVFKDVGCGSGLACPFCHLCQPGEKKWRKAARQAAIREVRRADSK